MTLRQEPWFKQVCTPAAVWSMAPLDVLDAGLAALLAGVMDGYAWEGELAALRALFMRRQGVSFRNRKRVHLAFDRMVATGLLFEHEGSVLLLYSETMVRKYRAVREAHLAAQTAANLAPNIASASRQKKRSTRNHSTPVSAVGADKGPEAAQEAPPTPQPPLNPPPEPPPSIASASRQHRVSIDSASSQVKLTARDHSTPVSPREREEREEREEISLSSLRSESETPSAAPPSPPAPPEPGLSESGTFELTPPSERPSTPAKVSPRKASKQRRESRYAAQRRRVVELFNLLFVPRFGFASQPKHWDALNRVTLAYVRDGDVLDETTVTANIAAFLADTWWGCSEKSPGYSIDVWARNFERYATKARVAAYQGSNHYAYSSNPI